MIGKMIGAMIGAKAAKSASGGLGGAGGALAGAGTVAVARRLGPLGLVAAGVGAYAYKRYSDRRKAEKAAPPSA